jgi:hypothetical protein
LFELSVLPDGRLDLTFHTLAPSWKGSLRSSRIAKVHYSFTKDDSTGETILQRFEQIYAGEKPIGKEEMGVIIKRLSEFRIWVADPDSEPRSGLWRESYNSKENPPKALKILIKWLTRENAPEIVFQTSLPIPCQASLRF